MTSETHTGQVQRKHDRRIPSYKKWDVYITPSKAGGTTAEEAAENVGVEGSRWAVWNAAFKHDMYSVSQQLWLPAQALPLWKEKLVSPYCFLRSYTQLTVDGEEKDMLGGLATSKGSCFYFFF